jgi:anaerobic magnesium-protoporphyrin IX monomethyl ester cyclase
MFTELGEKVEVFDYSKYNFVSPIMKPDNIDRAELLDGVMANYRRFYMKRMLFQYPWVKDPFRRRYLIGCIKAFFKSAMERKFYQLGQQNYWGPMFKKLIRFDYNKAASKIEEPDHNAWKQAPAAKRPIDGSAVKPEVVKKKPVGISQPSGVMASVKACGGAEPAHAAMACGGGDQQMTEEQIAQYNGPTGNLGEVAVPVSAIGKAKEKAAEAEHA